MSEYGNLITETRINLGYTLRKFCLEFGYDCGNFSKMERGLLNPYSGEKLLKLCKELRLCLEDKYTLIELSEKELQPLQYENRELQAKLKQKDAVIAELSRIKTDYTEFLHFIEYNSGCGDIVGCASFNRKRLVKFLSKIKQIQSEQDDGNE